MGALDGRKIAVLATDGFEQLELTEPVKAFKEAGARVTVISPKIGAIQGMHHDKRGETTAVDLPLSNAKPEDFDGLLLPGGVANPDALRVIPKAVEFVRAVFQADKPIAAICHGPWMLIEAQAVDGRRVTSWPSLRTDLENAGATWVDEPVVKDATLVTSRKPDDIPRFVVAAIEMFAK